ncbi:MAG: hypothetical protein HOO86_14035 [Bacteroidales bacterium]|nr:hypothetical protein [Bacteroidales bacterium]
MIYETIRTIYHFYYPEINPDETKPGLQQMMEAIESKDKETLALLRDLKLKYESYQFVKQDIELRSKVKDIWTMQLKRTKNDLQECILNYNNWALNHVMAVIQPEDLLL